jgi:hypothetical protein
METLSYSCREKGGKEEEMFNPECYLPTEKYFKRYESALMELSDEDLWVWLMYRLGKSQTWIAGKMGVTQSAISHRIKKIDRHFQRRVRGEQPFKTLLGQN